MTATKQQIWTLSFLIAVLGFLSGSIFIGNTPSWWPASNWFNRFQTHLGLDLQGGAHLLYEADTSRVTSEEAESAVAGVRDVIERRVNALGVSEPLVQTAQVGDKLRIIVELAGVFDVNEAIAQIGATPLLEFKTEAVPPEPEELSAEQRAEREAFNAEQRTKAQTALASVLNANGENFAQVATDLSEDPGSAANGGDLGFIQRALVVEEFGDALFDQLQDGEITPELIETQFGYHIIQRLESKQEEDHTGVLQTVVRGRHILLQTQSLDGDIPQYDPWATSALGGKQLTKAEIQFDNISGSAQVGLLFDNEGSDLFETLTDENIGKRLGIFLDGNLISAPIVNQKITGGRAVINGDFTIPKARELVERLNAGALPIPINLVSQQTVGPTLGAVSVERSLTAGFIGFALVILIMLMVYRFAGFLAVIALFFYASILFTLFKLFPITLTLAGIAGFLLSVGMAVDANVLIFERLREELRSGEPLSNAVRIAFDRAWNSIRDSNMSTLITCLILAWFGTSVIKGFAITLGFGVLVSMFSAIVVTRLFVEIAARNKVVQKNKWIWGA